MESDNLKYFSPTNDIEQYVKRQNFIDANKLKVDRTINALSGVIDSLRNASNIDLERLKQSVISLCDEIEREEQRRSNVKEN